MRLLKNLISNAVIASILLQLLIPIHVFAGAHDPELTAQNSFTGTTIFPQQVINDFNTADQAALWSAGSNVNQVNHVTTILNTPGVPFEGEGALEIVPAQVKAYEWRTIYRTFDSPLDLSDDNFIAVAANIWGWKQDDYFLKMTLTSDTDTYEAISTMALRWNVIYFDIHNWANKHNIKKIEFSYMKNYNLEGMSPGEPGYDYWDGRLQLDFLSATQAANLDFNNAGVTEGFSAVGGTAAVNVTADNHSLQYTVSDTAYTYLESPSLKLDASKRNVINLRMKNNTGAEKVKIAWITDQDQSWNEEKSMQFDISDTAVFIDYSFGMTNALWQDKIDKIRISPMTAAAANTMLDIDKINFSLHVLDTYNYQGNVESTIIDSDKTTITVRGSVKAEYLSSNPLAEVMVFELPVYTDEMTADYTHMTALDTKTAADSFNLSFNVAENGKSRIYSKFIVVLKNGNGEYVLADMPKYVTNPEVLATNTYPYTATKSIKGTGVSILTDGERLGAQHSGLNISYNQLLSLSDHGAGSISYEYEGKTYYFWKNSVNSLDNQIKSLTANGIAVTGILLMQRTGMDDPDSPNKDIIHPDSTSDGIVFAPNLTNEVGVDYYKAITSFLVERYSRADKAYGRIMGYIVGNEVGNNKAWNNMGPKLMEDYVKQYERTLRLTYNIIKSKLENARIYISLDHFWNDGHSPESMWAYDNKAIVDTLSRMGKEGGDYGWDVAFHPYPEDLFNPRTWADTTATDSFETYRITFKNLQVLTNYLQQTNMTFNGSQRHVILSEQGFHSGTNSLEDQKLQAAAFAYAYYKVISLPGIDAFFLSRQVDHAGEGGLNLGMWTTMPGKLSEAGEQKYIYDVFRKIDTVDSLAVTDFAKSIIGVSEWSEVIPEFDPSKLETRPAQAEVPMGIASALIDEVPLSNFDVDVNGWFANDNVSDVVLDTADKAAGASSLKAPVTNSPLKDYKGVTKVLDTPLDLTATPIIKASLKASGIGAGEKAEFMIRVYSGDRVSEGSVITEAETWNEVGLNLTGWEGINSVDRIKVWARPEKPVAWTTGAIQVDEVSLAASAVLTNLTVSLDRNEVVNIGDTLIIHIQNKSNQTYTGTMEIAGLNGITLDKSSSMVSIASGEQASIETAITGITLENYQSGKLKVTVGGKDYIYELTETYFPDYTLDGENLVLGDFEGGYTDGWIAGSHTAYVASVQTDSTYQTFPAAANHGHNMLESAKAPDVATTESKVIKILKTPVDLSAYDNIKFDIYGWGGTSSAYLAKIKLTAADGATYDFEQEIDPNWFTVSADISNFVGKNNVQSIEISYRGKDTQFYSGIWGGFFYIDNVRATSAIRLTGITPDKSAETLALDGGSMQLLIRGSESDGTSKDVSTAVQGTTYTGYDGNIITVTADGFITAIAAGTTAITVSNGGQTAQVNITVAANLPKSVYSFETGLEGWGKSNSADYTIGGVSAALSSGGTPAVNIIPRAENGGKMLQVDMNGVSPTIAKMVGIDYVTAEDFNHVDAIQYYIFSWGGLAGPAKYNTIFRLTSDTGEIFEKTTEFEPGVWSPITIDLGMCSFKERIVKMEIGHRADNSETPAWAGKFFIDNISSLSNIDKIAPADATLTADITALTNADVSVNISFPADAAVKEYKVGASGIWKTYTAPVVISVNNTVYARGTDAAGNISNTTSLNVNNIDKVNPTATIAYTATQDVVAMITPSEPITITNNGGSGSYTFYYNGSFTFEFIDAAGNQGTATAIVNNIVSKSKAKPGIPVVSDDNSYDTGLQDGKYNVTMNMWHGENGRLYQLYENDILIDTKILTDNSPNAQATTTAISGKLNGTYRYYAKLTNAFGTTISSTHTVTVTKAAPGKPALSNDNWDGDGNFKISMNMWWGTNGATYNLYENGILIYTQAMTNNTPSAQSAMTTLANRIKGTYEYRAELVNYAGATSSDKMIVKVTK